MDIVVCGAQKPFMRGGAEQAQEALVAALAAAGHRSELVRLPVAWEKDRLFDAPLAWRMVPIDADLVIATNFPSYFVRHPRKVVWLFHQHRGAYDGADSGAEWSDMGLDDQSLEVQRLLAQWDGVALGEASAIFTISQVVATRLARYTGLTGIPLYHPPPLADRLHVEPAENYVLTVHRFEANKRPFLLGEALARTTSRIRGVAAGTGTLFGDVVAAAAKLDVASRMDFPGFVSDDDLVDLYARALAVVYVPEDEDYGYVTLQAFLAGKPVITSADAGGALEWVDDGVTGLVTDGSPASISAAIDLLASDPGRAAEMGARAHDRVHSLGWAAVVDRLLAT